MSAPFSPAVAQLAASEPALCLDDAQAIAAATAFAATLPAAAPTRDAVDELSQRGLWTVAGAGRPGAVSFATIARILSLVASAHRPLARILGDHYLATDAFGLESGDEDAGETFGSVATLVRAAIAVGLADRAIEATIAAARRDPEIADDPSVFRDVADLEIRLHAAAAVLAKAGRTIDASRATTAPDGRSVAVVTTMEAEVLALEIATLAHVRLEEFSGPREDVAADDRHSPEERGRDEQAWAPNPTRRNVRAIGDHVVNGTPPASPRDPSHTR